MFQQLRLPLATSEAVDFADATLVHLAQREGLSTVFTADHADINTYQNEGRKWFSNIARDLILNGGERGIRKVRDHLSP